MGTITRLQASSAENLDIGITGAIDWATPTGALTSNNLYATASFNESLEIYGISQYLYVSNFGFSLPDAAVIDGIVASVERKGVGEAEDYYVGLVYTASGLEVTSPGKQKVSFWPTTDGTTNYGSSSDTWNKVWLPSEINDSNFGLGLSAEGRPAQADAALVDFIDITVYWHQEINTTISGGLGCSGSADVFMPTASAFGRVRVSGQAVVSQLSAQEGGVNAGGSAAVALIQFPAELGEYHWSMYVNSGEPSAPQSHDKTGWASFWLNPDTNEFGWDIRFDFDIDARIIRVRGPADFGNDSTAQIQIGGISGYSSPNIGSTTITELQKADLLNGLWYVWLLSWDDEQLRGQITKYQTGIHTSGTAIHIQQEFGEGGTNAGGAADINVEYIPVISMGVELSGIVQISINPYISGGITLGGSPTPTTWHSIFTVGGATSGGDVFKLLTYNILTSGGTEVNGTGTIGIAPAIGGGCEISGSHVQNYIAGPSMIGGAFVIPLHIQTFTDFYISVATMRAGGKARDEKIKFFPTSPHIGYGRAMGSENIFTAVVYEQELIPPTGDVSPELEETRFRMEHTGIWCDVGSACGRIEEDGAVLPEIIQRRQVGHLPPQTGSDTSIDRGIATVDAV